MEGTVKWFNFEKGYGFVTGEDGKDYFVHHSQVPEGMRINENDKIEFETAMTDRGAQARNVRAPGEGSSEASEEATEEPAEDAAEESTEEADEEGDEPAEEASEDSAEEATEEPVEDDEEKAE